MGFRRKHCRIEIVVKGWLERGMLSAPCQVLDVSETGMQLESRLFVKRGEVLHLVIELKRGKQLTCELKVVHVRSPRLGTKILSISPVDRMRLTELIEDRVHTGSYRW